MIVIDGKAHRNMPEQVAKNQEDIKKIFQTLDGLNIQDNVVVIDDITIPLTLTELEIINREVAFLIYNDQLFIKKNQDASTAYFDVVFSISGTSVITFTAKEIQVTLSNGGLNLITSTIYSYSKDEMDTLLGAKASISYVDTALLAKANLNGANFTGAITAPSIIENMSGYSMASGTITNATKTDVYGGIVKNGNKLTLVYAGKITRTGTVPSANVVITYIYIPAEIGAKLFVAIGSLTLAKNIYLAASTVTQANDKQIYASIFKNSNTQLTVIIPFDELNKLELNEEYYIRVESTFLLSDSLL